MEKFVTIQQQLPFNERTYQDRNGMNQVFASMGFILSDGIDTFYAEMQGDIARANKDVFFDTNIMHSVQCVITTRSWQDQSAVTHHSNEIRIIRLV